MKEGASGHRAGWRVLLLGPLSAACGLFSEPAPAVSAEPVSKPAQSGPVERATGDEIPAGSIVQILEIAPEDPFHVEAEKLIGRRCQVRGEGLEGEEGFFTGRLRCDYDPEYYFSRVAVGVVKEGKLSPVKAEGTPFEGEEVPPGSRVKLLEFSPDDALYPWPKELTTRADELLRRHGNLVGQICEVAPDAGLGGAAAGLGLSLGGAPGSAPASAQSQPASAPAKKAPRGLVSTGDGWYGGTLLCNNQKIFVYQAAIEVL